MAAQVYRITRYDGTTFDATVGTGDFARSHMEMPDHAEKVSMNVRWPHVLYLASKREGKFAGTFDEFLNECADYDPLESGESTAPPA